MISEYFYRFFQAQLQKTYKSIQKSYTDVMTSFYKNDKKEALKIELSNRQRIQACDKLLSKDIRKDYCMEKKETKKMMLTHVHEHMIMTEIISNLKAMATSIKLIARIVLNRDTNILQKITP
jgi:hypothetical protein